ncbi:MAG: VOC family protein [Panacagrimonas sp.]
MQVQTYLSFNGRCEEAIEFYRQALGAEPEMLMRFKDSPEPMPPGMLPPGYDNKVMHTSFRIGETMVMADDGGGCQDASGAAYSKGFSGFSLTLNLKDEAEAQKRFAALAEGGQIKMPLGKTFWSPCFGMLADRFGVSWMVNVIA